MEGVGERDSLMVSSGWHRLALDAWPSPLPQGANEAWTGWSSVPSSEEEWPSDKRRLLHDVLERQYAAAGLVAPPSLSGLLRSGCRAVVVGHQLVLGGGPAFFHHKILTAIRTARQLETRWGTPVVPVFWMASEDHDWKEIATLAGSRHDHFWKPVDEDVPHPVGMRSLDGVQDVLQSWGADGAPAEEAQALLDDLAIAQEVGETLSGVFRRWLHRWYGADQLLVLDPMDESLKKSASALWAAEFEGAGVHAALMGSAEASGPAMVRENNVFWLEPVQGRIGVVRDSGGWKAGSWGMSDPTEGWSAWAHQHAAQCSPGVLLRPLYQEWLLHSAAVVLGPGEWSYWHQVPAAFERHGVTFPALRLRDHGVVKSPEVHAVGWRLEDGWMHDEVWDRWILDTWMEEHGTALQSLEANMQTWLNQAVDLSSDVVPSASGATGALESGVQKAWAQWLKKVRRSLKGQRAEAWGEARRACEFLMRRGVPQDRWANWHVLAGSSLEAARWREAWLVNDGELMTRVWCFGPSGEKSPSLD